MFHFKTSRVNAESHCTVFENLPFVYMLLLFFLSKGLKKKVAKSSEITDLSKQFIMINIEVSVKEKKVIVKVKNVEGERG